MSAGSRPSSGSAVEELHPSRYTRSRRATLARWRNAIIAAFAVGSPALATWCPGLPALRADLDLNTGGIGVLLAGVTVGSVAGLRASSPLLGRLGPRRAVPGAMQVIAVSVVVVAGAGVLHSIPMVGLGFVIAGFAIGALDVTINVEGAAIEQTAGRTLMPLMHAAWSAGSGITALN